ncbi:dephospho-CoA kinase [Ereboglobus sp. PH5-5]|uniref:dephospho-CoA kinase n=1 Tax=Ereboglobus sp. PH5-5 TaxID=2940529 RepID=UPI00240692FD|nr:dephospho-CoA kinase [Ereboglobus sp. PH5-5]MDF9832216.1 dephospho-CoA kinase [Ereboglobus sp. PH5-5]
MILGITGGMGCGKSTATRIFEEMGFRRIDSDALVRDRILTAPECVAEAERRFGAGVIVTDAAGCGQIDRAALARVLFADEAKLRAWEDFVLPRLYVLWREQLEGDRAANWVVEAPLLYEKGLENWFDFVVCVASSGATQFARLAGRGVSHTLAAQRISKQLPLAQKIEKADFVLSNDGSTDFLRDQIKHLAARLV